MKAATIPVRESRLFLSVQFRCFSDEKLHHCFSIAVESAQALVGPIHG